VIRRDAPIVDLLCGDHALTRNVHHVDDVWLSAWRARRR
jgi:hypothetical protein